MRSGAEKEGREPRGVNIHMVPRLKKNQNVNSLTEFTDWLDRGGVRGREWSERK